MSEMPKVRVYATIREDFVKWIDKQVEKLALRIGAMPSNMQCLNSLKMKRMNRYGSTYKSREENVNARV